MSIYEHKEEMDQKEREKRPPADPIERAEDYQPLKDKKPYHPKIRELNDRRRN